MSDDLVAFLRARLDDDEWTARAAKPGPWHADGGSVYATHPTDEVVGYTDSAEHIARHDPARVLAEVEAKRRLLELHEPGEMEYVEGDVCMACDLRGEGPYYPCLTLRLLALPHAEHPDYRDEWRP
jgi:hypothetical protein